MKRILSILVCAALTISALVPTADAARIIERQSDENPVKEVAKSTLYGFLGGVALGSAIALADNGDNGDEIMRWSIVGGTFIGFGYGIYHVSTRPKSTALLDFREGRASLHAALPEPRPGRGITLRLIAVNL